MDLIFLFFYFVLKFRKIFPKMKPMKILNVPYIINFYMHVSKHIMVIFIIESFYSFFNRFVMFFFTATSTKWDRIKNLIESFVNDKNDEILFLIKCTALFEELNQPQRKHKFIIDKIINQYYFLLLFYYRIIT